MADPLEYERQIADLQTHPAVLWSWRSENRILNVAVSGDPEAVELELRALYEGPLCVVAADSRQVRLREIEIRIEAELRVQNIPVVAIGLGDNDVQLILEIGEPQVVKDLEAR